MDISANTPVEDVLKIIHFNRHGATQACPESVDVIRGMNFQKWGELADHVDPLTNPKWQEGWSMWLLTFYGSVIDPDVRKKLIISIHDPMTLLTIYLDYRWPTDEEDVLLQSGFVGKLPHAEQELRDGIVSRKKQ